MSFKVRKRELLYFTGLFLMSFSNIVINGSYIGYLLPEITNTIVKYLALLLMFMSILNNKWRLKQIVEWIMVGVLSLIVCLVTDKPTIVLTIFAIISASGIEYRKILKFIYRSIMFNSTLVVILCLCGVIPDILIKHGNVEAHCLGYLYYSNLSTQIMMLTILYFTLRGKTRFKDIVIWVLVNFACYKICTTRLTFGMTLLYLCFVLILGKKPIRDTRIKRFFSTVLYPFGAFISIASAFLYGMRNPLIVKINSVLASRIRWNYDGIVLYGFKWFGNNIKMVGGTEIANGVDVSKYFYIDSGYIYSLLEYGIILFAIIILCYILIFRFSVKTNNSMLFAWSLIISGHSLINDLLFNVTLNPLLLLLPTVLSTLRYLEVPGEFTKNCGPARVDL